MKKGLSYFMIFSLLLVFGLYLPGCKSEGGKVVLGSGDTTLSPSSLSSLSLSKGSLNETFSPNTTSYTSNQGISAQSVTVTPTAANSHATITVNGTPVTSGSTSAAIPQNLGDNTITVVVTPTNGSAPKTYTITTTRGLTAQQAYAKASNTETNDYFGFSVAISGDTIVVGAKNEDSNATGVNNSQGNGATNSGAAYVFVRTGDTWAQQAYLKASNTDTNDEFGTSVAIFGDTIVVGAKNEDSDATGVNGNESNNSRGHSGAAYVFYRTGTTWARQAYLKASNTDSDDLFGCNVAIAGDTIVVGARNEDSDATGVNGNDGSNSLTDPGAAYVFFRTGTTWTQQAYLKASNTGATDQFGKRVAISGDTIVVGAFNEDSDATGVTNGTGSSGTDTTDFNSGAAYVFHRTSTTWTQQAYLKASNTGGGDFFGGSVAISGDTIVVGAYGEASNATGVGGNESNDNAGYSGAAYIFYRTSGSWAQQAYLKASNTDVDDRFGWAVAISGNAVVVGAYFEDSNATGLGGNETDNNFNQSGAAYLFYRTGTTWTRHAYLKASNTRAYDYFGQSVAIDGDTVVVGAYKESSDATGITNGTGSSGTYTRSDSGSAYIFK